MVPKFCKLLSGESYPKNMFDENGQILYPTNRSMPSSSNQPGSMVLHHEFNLFYDTPVVCGYSKCKRLKENRWCATLSHYINDWIPKVDSLIPPTMVNNLIGDIEKTCRICSFFENLEAKSTKFCPKLTNPSPFVQSTESSSEPKYDINSTQNISTRISKKLYELRAKFS